MKKRDLQWIYKFSLLFAVAALISFSSCKKDDKDDEPVAKNPVASFQFEVSSANFLEVSFTNFSQNATIYSWNFGDGQTSTETSPTHVYESAGQYEVVLTASNAAGASANFSQNLTITDPNDAYKLLTGDVSKTWKLFREGTSMSLGESLENPANWWEGLQNDGARPCLYYQEFTFHFDGTYEFNDNGMFWGEFGVFDNTEFFEVCFEAIPGNMINLDGVDVSAWLSGTHAFTYDPSVGSATLTGEGAWIGIPKLATTGAVTVPQSSVTFNIVEIVQESGYDLMTIGFDYGEDGYWKAVYASYSDPSLEPEVVEEAAPYGEDLPDLTPTEMYNTFASATDFVLLDTAAVYPGTGLAGNGVDFTMGVVDPAGGATPVGQYNRVGQYQELQFMQANDIQFDNFTTVSVDVYVPSTNDFSGDLTKTIGIIIGEASQTEQWWTGHIQYDVDPESVVLDEWQTWTFQLNAPTSGAGSYTPYERTDLDFFAISIGGGGHTAPGTFYIRNFKFE
ncbi:MAG: PKD domain-containing protein [Bacteroidetes bacterium]|nr:PKD domain-containing protein [Bacteroidota bacterium]MBU1578292.1 PKD domain-containing protein [Bacteroidota bacterium]MBU2466623.1 PKD domain-containing protein [Bacteroidota bacterium]MBU2556361.1 PKD domain-containing protein [Bacteroidota bacterium]